MSPFLFPATFCCYVPQRITLPTFIRTLGCSIYIIRVLLIASWGVTTLSRPTSRLHGPCAVLLAITLGLYHWAQAGAQVSGPDTPWSGTRTQSEDEITSLPQTYYVQKKYPRIMLNAFWYQIMPA